MYILLGLVFVKCVLLYKLYSSVPALELKRRARGNDKRSASLYKVAAYQADLDVMLWILGTASAATLFIWSARTSWWLAVLVIIFAAWLVIWAPKPRYNGWAGALAAISAKYQAVILSFLHPVLSRLGKYLRPAGRQQVHTGIYEKKDLMDFINRQNKQSDNRIDEADLRIAFGAISFGDKLVSAIMTPRRKVKLVGAGESVGPMLMDELHKSGHSRFPVVKDNSKGASTQIVGTLYLKDIIGYEGGGKVKDLARKDVYFINEESNLRQALSAFLKTHHHLLIVVNNFEEVLGVLSIEDVLEQIIGKPISDNFDSYESLRAVAAKETKQGKTSTEEAAPAPPETKSE